ncbi:MAG: 23S rRNA (adenine(2503)-C(2))-methyltransferase RlmN [Firmicutes bacterium]|nr:23S rRNA (adenine(2503)-C(2))-methyltransferase RlmN [Candidatus Colimorpha enterica]
MAVNMLGMTENEVAGICGSLSITGFRIKQIYKWVSAGKDVPGMTNLPASVRASLTEAGYGVFLPKIEKKLVSSIDGTVKYLFSLSDGELIESVVMKYEHGNTICVSCQAGCRMGCRFCASTLNGKVRDLHYSEILGQVYAAEADTGEKISNIVMMGIGEPLDNYDNTVKFLHTVNSPDGLNIGFRHISLSTCGVVSGIDRLAEEDMPITLSISLHCIDNEKRKELMPVTKKWSVDELLAACKRYFDRTGRRISFEYTLIAGENDSVKQAAELAEGLKKHLGRMPIHVNLIPLNPVKERGLGTSAREDVKRFQDTLISHGINATVRRKLGPDINASCGQLRHSAKQENEENTEKKGDTP